MAKRVRLLTEMARQMLASGADTDQVAMELLRDTDSPISAIKAVADATGLGLGDAKWVVHRNLRPEVREAAERLWDDLLDGLGPFQEPPSEPDIGVRTFDDLVDEGAAADVSGWGFDWLDGRATEQRPPWGYSRLLASRLAQVGSALDIDTGGGEIIAEMPQLPSKMVVTEGWPPNIERARRRLSPRGVEVVPVAQGRPLPFPDASFELVSSRHPVRPDWPEIARVLTDHGAYLAQHVGPESAFELIEWFRGQLPRQPLDRDPEREAAAARSAGLQIVDLRTARCRMEFFDIAAVVYILRKCVWWVPDFTADRYREALQRLDVHIREHGAFLAHSTRTLIEATRMSR